MFSRMYFIIALSIASLCATVQADLIPLVLQPTPDMSSGFINTTFSEATDEFSAIGWSSGFFDGSSITPMTVSGIFSMTAFIDDFGVASSGSFSIDGEVLGYSGTLLSGTLLAGPDNFGWSNTGSLFEFVFEIDGGSMAEALYGGFGTLVGMILSPGSNDFTDWSSDFSHTSFGGVADVATIIPAPATFVLFVGAAFSRRRRRR